MTTAARRAPLRLDPYFSGERQTQPAPQGYHDISQEPVLGIDGRHPTAVMRQGTGGLRGTVIPKATQGGIPIGTRPHAVQDMTLIIDPHLEGQSTTLNLRDVTPRAMREAAALAAEEIPYTGTIEEVRLQSATAIHQLAAMAREGHQQAPQPSQPSQPAYYQPQQPMTIQQAAGYGAPAAAAPMQQARPLHSFLRATAAPQPAAEHYREPRSIMLDTPQAAPPAVPPPAVEVIFEIENFGQHTANYHDVIATDGFILLILRQDWRASRFFPQPSEHPMAIMVAGRPEVYLVQTTGVRYSYANHEFCLLLVTRVVDSRQTVPPQQVSDQG